MIGGEAIPNNGPAFLPTNLVGSTDLKFSAGPAFSFFLDSRFLGTEVNHFCNVGCPEFKNSTLHFPVFVVCKIHPVFRKFGGTGQRELRVVVSRGNQPLTSRGELLLFYSFSPSW